MSCPECGNASYRKQRIDRLLHELRYEIARGLAEGDITEEMTMRYIAAIKDQADKVGIIRFELRFSKVHAGVIQGLYE